MSHMHRWIAALMDNLDAQVDEQTGASVLENCGRACIPRSFVEKAVACRRRTEDLDGFLNELGKIWSHLHRDGDNVYVVYDACYCSLVKGYPGQLSPIFCNCSRGWIKELFEKALERPVEVELEQSIKQGDPVCKFLVRLQDFRERRWMVQSVKGD